MTVWSSLTRHVPLSRQTPQSRALARLMLKRRHELLRRSGGRCERCGTPLTVYTCDPSHRRPRRENDHRLCTLTASCRPCHRYTEEHPLIAMEQGFKVPAGVEPTDARVKLWDGRWVRLTEDGQYVRELG